jgi:hypothetical protein
MNDFPRTLLVATIATAITITGCSSSNDTLGMLDDPQSEVLNAPDSRPNADSNVFVLHTRH